MKKILLLFHACGSRAELVDYDKAICYNCGTTHSRDSEDINQREWFMADILQMMLVKGNTHIRWHEGESWVWDNPEEEK